MSGFALVPTRNFLPLATLSGAWPVSDCGRIPLPLAYACLVQGRLPFVVGHMKDLAAFKKHFGGQTTMGELIAQEKGRA